MSVPWGDIAPAAVPDLRENGECHPRMLGGRTATRNPVVAGLWIRGCRFPEAVVEETPGLRKEIRRDRITVRPRVFAIQSADLGNRDAHGPAVADGMVEPADHCRLVLAGDGTEKVRGKRERIAPSIQALAQEFSHLLRCSRVSHCFLTQAQIADVGDVDEQCRGFTRSSAWENEHDRAS